MAKPLAVGDRVLCKFMGEKLRGARYIGVILEIRPESKSAIGRKEYRVYQLNSLFISRIYREQIIRRVSHG